MNEQQLVSQILSGSDSAMRLFISKYKSLVSHMVARVIADHQDREELCQDVFIKAFDKIDTFKFEAKLSTWLAAIAYRAAVNFAKKKRLDQVDIEEVGYAVWEEDGSTEKDDMNRYIHHLIDKLPAQYKSVLTLFYLEGFSYPEIVEITEMPEGTVKNYIHRARTKLRELVEQHAQKEIALI